MAYESPLIHDGNCVAGADMTLLQFTAVMLSTTANSTVLPVTTAAVGIYGILQNDPLPGDAADVGIIGVSMAKAGGAFTAGQPLSVNATGELIAQTSTNVTVAFAKEASAGAGQIVSVTLASPTA